MRLQGENNKIWCFKNLLEKNILKVHMKKSSLLFVVLSLCFLMCEGLLAMPPKALKESISGTSTVSRTGSSSSQAVCPEEMLTRIRPTCLERLACLPWPLLPYTPEDPLERRLEVQDPEAFLFYEQALSRGWPEAGLW